MGGFVGKSEALAKGEKAELLPELYIKAINPGYTVDGKSNVGEMIEIGRRNSDDMISLAGIAVSYTNSSGNSSTLFEFPENSFMTGETILLRLASSPDSELASATYTKTLAFKAGLEVKRGEEVVDAVCWTGKDGCYRDFKSASPTILVRNLDSGEFEHVSEYEPSFVKESYVVQEAADEEGYGAVPGHCKGLRFSEILSYYETLRSEQFIEMHNTTAEQMLLDGCKIRYKNKNYSLGGIVGADGYLAYYPQEFALTKNPTNSNRLELIDADGAIIDVLSYPNGQRKGTAYALIGFDERGEAVWKVTYAPTPGEANNYQEFKTCEVGKVINEATGNCVKMTAFTEKICPAGQYLNILTGRCKKYEEVSEKTCKEGYYLNPETGRCRKIVENDGADYSVKPEEYTEEASFVALYAVLGVVGLGLVILVYEFRKEIWRFLGKLKNLFRRK